MRFVVDAQMPPRLGAWLRARGQEAEHVQDLPDGLRLADADIWAHCLSVGAIVVSKDKDFLDMAAVRGTPPVVLLVTLGNASTAALLQALEVAWPTLLKELSRPEAGVVVLERERVVVTRLGS